MPGVEVLLGGEVETVGLVRLQVIVDDDAVDNAGVCTDGGEQGIGVLGAVVILVVAVGLGAEDDLAAVVRVLLQRGDLGSVYIVPWPCCGGTGPSERGGYSSSGCHR